jgi:prevent-host-death family protein
MSSGQTQALTLGVAEAKRRFSELLDRVGAGERVVIHRRGRPAVVLVPASADAVEHYAHPPLGLASVAGGLADWEDLEAVVEEIYAARRATNDRPAPDLG